MVVSVTMEIIC